MNKQELSEVWLNHLQTFRSWLELFGKQEELYLLFNKVSEDNYEVSDVSKDTFNNIINKDVNS
jgi:hypothetical protein